ncbi:hypothetical protein PybrP1_007218 [[Pythium] brassicae (nom. inval.)]|nr:hypothetical protein PybrP1_007218 [[Pythium] brassicae (nom. inval.)]
MALSAAFSAAMAATSDGGSRFIQNARALWLARLMEEDDDSDDESTAEEVAAAAAGGDLVSSTPQPLPLPLPPMARPAALMTSAAPAASMVVDLTTAGDVGPSIRAATSEANNGSRHIVQIIDDDDENDENDGDSGEFFMLMSDLTPPPPSSNASTTAPSNPMARKRPRSEMTTRADPEVVVVETKVVERAQATECTVCCDPCTVSGPHRLVALKCGHLFGKHCIERWLLTRKACPICNVAVRKPDIRALFSDHVAVVDNSGVVEMTAKFEAEKAKRIQLEAEVARLQAEVVRLTSALTEAQKLAAKPRWK